MALPPTPQEVEDAATIHYVRHSVEYDMSACSMPSCLSIVERLRPRLRYGLSEVRRDVAIVVDGGSGTVDVGAARNRLRDWLLEE